MLGKSEDFGIAVSERRTRLWKSRMLCLPDCGIVRRKRMNLVKHYIKEIHGIKHPEKYPDLIVVDVTFDCYGIVKRAEHITRKEQWKKDVELGYFLA